MRSTLCWLGVTTLVLLAVAAQAPAHAQTADPASAPNGTTTADLSGRWEGAIEVPGVALGIIVTLRQEGGAWAGTIDIPAQGLAGFALADVTVEGSAVGFAMDGVPGRPTFAGTLAESGDAIAGRFTQGGQELAFSLARAAAGAGDTAAATEEDRTPVPGDGPVGIWLGALDVGPTKLRLLLEVASAGGEADGGAASGLTATLDSIDQGAKFDVATIAFADGELTFAIETIGGSFKGTMNDDGSAIAGTWSQGGNQLPLTFRRQTERLALRRPQEPEPPFPYTARDVTFPGGDEGVELAGTILVPEGAGPFRAVVFATGSGPQDRDETLMNHRPFLVIADHLARRGIASLRYDDRGVGESGGDHFGSTVGDFADDLAAALATLGQQPEVAGRAIGIVGHSEGGLSAMKVAAALPAAEGGPDFLVFLAAPGEPLTALLERQARDLTRAQGLDEALVERMLASQAEELAILRAEGVSREELQQRLRARAEREVDEQEAADRAALGLTPEAIEQAIQQATTPWFLSLLREDPAEHLAKVQVPVLALFGEKDLQVAAEVNAEIVRTALPAVADRDVRILPGLNHLFQHATTGRIDEYGVIEETFAPEALEIISTWIGETAGGGERAAAASAEGGG